MARTFEMTIKGATELSAALMRYPDIAKPIVQRAIVGVSAVLAKHTLKNNPVPWRTGVLLHSFRFKSGPGWARWYPTAYYAQMVEEGTRPHRIYPKTAKALSWKTGGVGQYVTAKSGKRYYKGATNTGRAFAKYVNHPGTKPHPFMQEILDNSRPDIERLFAQATDKILAEIAGKV
jgi:hypothetical protein